MLSDIEIKKIASNKLIRDGVHRSFTYYEWEISIMDLPIFQRLRKIHQTALSHLVYPTATHNRFQHSLGVLIIADQFSNILAARYSDEFDPITVKEIRLAALLHDIGHCPFSHPSDDILSNLDDMKEKMHDPSFSKIGNKPHEILSFLLLTSNSFRDFFAELMDVYDQEMDIEKIAKLIIGEVDDPDDTYKSDIINGAFDADKLDYIVRDSYFTGLKLGVDLDRIMHSMRIDERRDEPKRLVGDISGAHSLEQVLFNKVMLSTSIYHHQKIRAIECMYKSIFEYISDNQLSVKGKNFKSAVDFLYFNDEDVLNSFNINQNLSLIIKNLNNRELLKRCLVMSRSTVHGEERNFEKISKLSTPDQAEKIKNIRNTIVHDIHDECSISEVWVDVPNSPSLREPSQFLIKMTEDDYIPLSEIFPMDAWLAAYSLRKLNAHVFGPPITRIRKLINNAAIDIFRETMGVEFTPYATIRAKIPVS